MLRILLITLLLLISCLSAFAMPHGTTFQIKNYWVLFPYAAIGIPIGDQHGIKMGSAIPNGIELGVTTYGGVYSLVAVFSSQIDSSEKERSLWNIGLLYWSRFLWAGSVIVPVLEYEQERLISEKFSWLLNFGYPSLVGLGLKWYL